MANGAPVAVSSTAPQKHFALCSVTVLLRDGGSGQQLDVAADRRRVDGERALVGETQKVMRAAGLRSGAREPLTPEGLYAHHRADHVAVHVGVADRERAEHVLGNALE